MHVSWDLIQLQMVRAIQSLAQALETTVTLQETSSWVESALVI